MTLLIDANTLVTVWSAIQARNFTGISTEKLKRYEAFIESGLRELSTDIRSEMERLRKLDRNDFLAILCKAEDREDDGRELTTEQRAAINLEESFDLAILRAEIARRPHRD